MPTGSHFQGYHNPSHSGIRYGFCSFPSFGRSAYRDFPEIESTVRLGPSPKIVKLNDEFSGKMHMLLSNPFNIQLTFLKDRPLKLQNPNSIVIKINR
jgi:hypothetical protein